MFKRFLGPNRPHLWDRQFEDIMGAKVIMAIASLEERAQVARDQSQKRLINEGQPVCTPTHSQRWPVGFFIEVTMMGELLTTCHKAQRTQCRYAADIGQRHSYTKCPHSQEEAETLQTQDISLLLRRSRTCFYSRILA